MKPSVIKRLLIFITSCCLFFVQATAQGDIESTLKRDIASARTAGEQVTALNALAHYYYSIRREKEGDALISQMVLAAEQSQDRQLLRTAFFENPSFTNSHILGIEMAEQKLYVAERALAYAQRISDAGLAALAYIQISLYYQTGGNLERADYHAELASTNALASGNDTSIILSYIQQGNVSQQMSKVLIALQKYSNALDLAVEKKITHLESRIYHSMAQLYKDIGQKFVSREMVLKSITLNRSHENRQGLMNDYFAMAKMCEVPDTACTRQYLDMAGHLADSLNNLEGQIEYRRLQFYALFEHATSDSMLKVLHASPQLMAYFIQAGPGHLDWLYGQIYLYDARGTRQDSALYYFRKAEDPLYQSLVMSRKKNFIQELAIANGLVNIPAAIENYKLLLSLNRQTSNWKEMANACASLMKLYEYSGNFEMAYLYNRQYDTYQNTYNEQSRQNQVDLLTLQNDRKEKERLQQIALEEKRREYNLQYLFIGVIIATMFTVLAMMGFYQVSRKTVRMVSFFSFLLLFEFVTLLSKKWMTYVTHGTPWQDMLFMIALAMLMLPLHHWLEHQVVEYLTSRELLKNHVTEPGAPKRSRRKEKSPSKKVLEGDTA